MKSLVLILLFALLFISQINTIVDIDLWWGLKTGECIVKNLEIPRVDIFSYTLQGRPWIDHEWLSQVLFYLVFSKFGWLGLNLLKAFVIGLCFFIMYFLASSGIKKTVFPLFFLLVSILAFGYRSFVRPEIFSYLLFCVFMYVLEKERPLAVLPFLQILWVNLHGYFIAGPTLIFLYFIGDFFFGEKKRSKKFAMVFLWAVAACFVNPYFYKGALYPVAIITQAFTAQKSLMRNIQELMMPARLNFARFFFFWILAILASATFIVNIKKAKMRHILIFAISFISAYLAIRNIPIFIFPAMAMAGMNLNSSGLTKRLCEKKYYMISMIIICSLIYLFLSNRYYLFTNQYGMRKTESKFCRLLTPEGACDFLEKNNIKGPLFNTMDFGPYIGYRFYPEKRIFIDTRTELYRDEFYNAYQRAQNYPGEWKRLQAEYGFNTALLRHLFGGTERILRALYKDNDWRLVYYDENSCIFLRDVHENQNAIERFGIDFRKKQLIPSDININIARFFEKIGELDFAEEVYKRILAGSPAFLEAGNNLGGIYINKARYKDAIELLERFLARYPGSAELYANIGTAYLRSGEREKGLRLLEKAAKIDPYLRKVSYMLGIGYMEEGDLDRALWQLVKYSRLDPYDPEARNILGDIYRQKGLLKKADIEYNEANKLEGLL
ncbi:MAG: tetratricopeptide repeat protein [Candidatus Omnitrophota bacterium]